MTRAVAACWPRPAGWRLSLWQRGRRPGGSGSFLGVPVGPAQRNMPPVDREFVLLAGRHRLTGQFSTGPTIRAVVVGERAARRSGQHGPAAPTTPGPIRGRHSSVLHPRIVPAGPPGGKVCLSAWLFPLGAIGTIRPGRTYGLPHPWRAVGPRGGVKAPDYLSGAFGFGIARELWHTPRAGLIPGIELLRTDPRDIP